MHPHEVLGSVSWNTWKSLKKKKNGTSYWVGKLRNLKYYFYIMINTDQVRNRMQHLHEFLNHRIQEVSTFSRLLLILLDIHISSAIQDNAVKICNKLYERTLFLE